MVGLGDERARIAKRLATLDAEVDVLRRQLALLDQAMALEEEKPIAVKRTRPSNPPRDEVVAIVIRAAEKARRPISRQEAMAAVAEAGLTIEGTRPIEVLATMLWRERDKVAKSNEGYWPADKPVPRKR